MGQIHNQDTDKKISLCQKFCYRVTGRLLKPPKMYTPPVAPTPLVVGDGGQQLADIFKISV